MVRITGVEPAWCYPHGPEPCASANSAISASCPLRTGSAIIRSQHKHYITEEAKMQKIFCTWSTLVWNVLYYAYIDTLLEEEPHERDRT